MKKDIQDSIDIQHMVDSFYQKVNQDKLLSPIFNDFAKVDWQHHLPVMYAFWAKILLGEGSYNGNPFMKHIPLPIEEAHFQRWLNLFTQTVDEHFEGENANEAKRRAFHIAQVFQYKLNHIEQQTKVKKT